MTRWVLGTNLNDRLFGLIGTPDDEQFRGKKGGDYIDAGDGKDAVFGEDGNDTLVAGNSDGTGDLYDGGNGTDLFLINGSSVGAMAFRINLEAGRDQYGNSYVSIENVTGGSADDVLIGSADDNQLLGRDGDDSLRGGLGNDTLRGDKGNDVIEGDAGADVIDGGDGEDTASYMHSASGVTFDLGTGIGHGGDAEGDTMTGIEHLMGSNFDDVLTGDSGDNRLNGRAGNDLLSGGDGNDTLIGAAGSDVMDGGDGTDTASYEFSGTGIGLNLVTGGYGGRAGGDIYISIENVTGSDFDDDITGDSGVNRLNGGDGNDTLRGGDGNDQLIGGTGADQLVGGAGIDTANYSTARAAIEVDLINGGGAGDAEGDSYASIEFVLGSRYDDTITGDDRNNRLYGGNGDDTLSGGGGKDTLIGGAGNDTMTGGDGYDVFWFRNADEGNDVITDFWSGSGMTDRIWLGAASGVSNFGDVLAACTDTSAGVEIALGNGTLLLQGVSSFALSADDFII